MAPGRIAVAADSFSPSRKRKAGALPRIKAKEMGTTQHGGNQCCRGHPKPEPTKIGRQRFADP